MNSNPTIIASRAEVSAPQALAAIFAPRGEGGILHVTSSTQGEPATVVRRALTQAREAGREARWATVASNGWFAAVGERLTARLQGLATDGGDLGEAEQRTYSSVLRIGAEMLAEVSPPFELAFVHDPATAGLCGPLQGTGGTVVWVCHLAVDEPNEASRAACQFLAPHLQTADSLVFLRPSAIPDALGEQLSTARSSSLGSRLGR